MTFEDVLALAKAGYNAQQISALAAAEKAPAPAPAPAPTPAQAPAPSPDPAPAPAPASAPAPAPAKSFDDIYKEIAGMRQDLNAANLLAAQQTGPAQPTADQIIANIINPPKREEK